jgi:cation diffusion facilitator CzcD-associated flavoprotein CzcO
LPEPSPVKDNTYPGCAREFDLLRHIRFHHEVQSAEWDASGRVEITRSRGVRQ